MQLALKLKVVTERGLSPSSRCNPTAPIDGFLGSDHHGCSLIAILTDIFRKLFIGSPTQKKASGPRARVRAGIINRDLDLHVGGIRTRKTLDEVKLVRMRRALALHPESFIETNGVDDQRLAFPMPDRVAVKAGKEILRVGSTVHVNDSECLWTILIEYVDGLRFGYIDKLDAAGCNELTRST